MSDVGVPGIRKKGMSSPFKSLLSMQFKVEYGQRGLSEKLGLGRKTRATWLYIALIALAFLPVIGLLYALGQAMAKSLVAMGQPGLQVILAMSAAQFIVLFVGISALMSALYYSADLETLQALPLTGRQILIAKVLVGYVAQLLFSSVVLLPFLVPLGIEMHSVTYWLFALVLGATAPAIPLALSLLATVLIMRATRRLKQRDLLRVVFGLAFFALIMAFEYVNVSFASGGVEEVMRAITQRNGLIQMISSYYPPLRWAAWSLTGDSIVSQLSGTVLFAGVSVVVLGACAGVSQKWFLGGVGREIGTGAKGRAAGGQKERGGAASVSGLFLRRRDPAAAVAWRDHRVLTRTPSFLLNTLTTLVIVPMMWMIMSVGGRGDRDLALLLSTVLAGQTAPVLLALVGVQGFLASLNQVAATSISREGGSFWLSKMVPVPASIQVRGKVRYSMAVSSIQLLTLLVLGALVFKMGPLDLATLTVLGLLVSWPVSVISLLNDLYRPRLNWTDPHQAMKGNFATLGAMLFSLAYIVAAGFLVMIAYRAGLAPMVLYLLCAAIAGGSGFALQKALETKAGQRYAAIEI